MNWNDTIGITIHNRMVSKALEQKPYADRQKLEESIARTSLTLGIARDCISDVLQAEIDTLIAMRVMGSYIPNDFLAGMLASLDLIRDGKHVLDDNDSNDNWS
jgi:hypothetical protein